MEGEELHCALVSSTK